MDFQNENPGFLEVFLKSISIRLTSFFKDKALSLGVLVLFVFCLFQTYFSGLRFTDIFSVNTFSVLWQGHWWQPEHFGVESLEILYAFQFAMWALFIVLLFFWLQFMFSSFVAAAVCLLLLSAPYRYEFLLDNYYRLILFNAIWGVTCNIFMILFLIRRDWKKYFYLAAFLVSAFLFFFTTPVQMIFVFTLFVALYRFRYYRPQRIIPLGFFFLCLTGLMFYFNDYMGFPGQYQFMMQGRIFGYLIQEIQVASGWDFFKFFSISFDWHSIRTVFTLLLIFLVLFKFRWQFPRIFLLFLLLTVSLTADILFNAYFYLPLDDEIFLKSTNLIIQMLLYLFFILAVEELYCRFQEKVSWGTLLFIPVLAGLFIYWQVSAFSVFSAPLHYLVQVGQNLQFTRPHVNTMLIQELQSSATGDRDHAMKVLRERSPVDYYFYLIGHYISRDEREDLLYLYQSLKRPGRDIKDELLLTIAAYFIALEEYSVVEEILEPFSHIEDPPHAYYFFQAQLYVQKSQYNELVDFLEENEEYIPEEDIYYFNGLLYFMQGDFDLARESFENIPHTLRRYPYAAFLMGRIFYYQQQYAQALTYFEIAYEGNFLSSALYLDYINCLLETHQFPKAQEMVGEALDLFPDDKRFLLLASMTYLELGKHYWYRFSEPYTRQYFLEKALSYLEKLIGQNPEDAYPYYLYSNNAMYLQKWEEAQWGIQKALKFQPKSTQYLMLQLEIALRMKDGKQAEAIRQDLFMKHAFTDEDLEEYIPVYTRFRNELGLPEL